MEAQKPSVLIVDDESLSITAFTQILRSEYTIYAAKCGRTGIEAAEKYLPDVILLDIVMPDMDGYEVLSVLKSSEKTQEIPVIIVSKLGEIEEEAKGLVLGAADYLTKPFSPVIVKLRLGNQIKIIQQMQRAIAKERALKKAEEFTKLMLDACPLCCQLWDTNFSIIDCNEAAVKLYGFKSKQEYRERFLTACSPECQPDGRRSADTALLYVKQAFDEGHCVFEWIHQTLDGRAIPSEVILVRINSMEDTFVAGYTRDMRGIWST